MSVDVSSVARAAGVSTAGFENMSLDTIMMMVNTDRANMLDGQVRAQAAAIKAKNDLLVQANNVYAQMKDLQQQAATNSQKYTDMPEDMRKFCDDNGIKYDATGKDSTGRIDSKHNKDEWETNMAYMKTFIDNLTSTSQIEMTQLQSVMNKFNQTTEGLSNWISKDSQSKNTITGNLR